MGEISPPRGYPADAAGRPARGGTPCFSPTQGGLKFCEQPQARVTVGGAHWGPTPDVASTIRADPTRLPGGARLRPRARRHNLHSAARV